jgi:TetR/AcrR family transcriptional regulator, transcriptional repressor for nem operon
LGEEPDRRTRRGEATRALILARAADLIRERGYAGLTLRAVAQLADVPLSLVQYHYGNKTGLLAALLRQESARVLERERQIYAQPGPLSGKLRWIYHATILELDSGFTRGMWELWSAGLEDPELAALWRETMDSWREMLEQLLSKAAEDGELPLPLDARAMATLLTNVFQGIEVELLAGASPVEAPHADAIEAVAALLEAYELSAGGAERVARPLDVESQVGEGLDRLDPRDHS